MANESGASRLQGLAAFISILASLASVVGLLLLVWQISAAREELEFARAEFLDYKSERRFAQVEKWVADFSSPRYLYYRNRAAEIEFRKFGVHTKKVFEFFEAIARAEKHGVVALDDISYAFQDPILYYWCGWKNSVFELRKKQGQPPEQGDYWKGMQDLAEAIKAKNNTPCLTDGELEEFRAFEKWSFVPEQGFSSTMSGSDSL